LETQLSEFRYGSKNKDTAVPECLSLLADEVRVPDNAQLCGYELLGIEWALSSFHSWLCHSCEVDVAAELGIRTNRLGLLASYEDASAVLEWMLALPSERSPEPAYWTVAAVAGCE
jgi:hypothetical protein